MSELKPIEASAGANNGKYIYCDKFNERKKYFVCLHIMAAKERGDIKPHSPSERCANAIDCGQCTAVGLRKEEIDAGHAIYWEPDPYTSKQAVERPRAERPIRPSFGFSKRPISSYGSNSKSPVTEPTESRTSSASKPKPIQKKEADFETMDLGKLVTDLAASETAVEVAKKVAVETEKPVITTTQAKPQRLPGESLAEMAKRLMKEKQK